MEEKERYIIYHFDGDIFDTKKGYYPSNQTICEIINQQDKRIKELEQENLSLQEQSIRDNQNWIEETTQLKQQLEDAEEHIDNLELQLREQYQIVDEKDEQLAEKEKEIEKITRIVAYKDDMDRSTTINGVKFTNEQIITLQNIDYFADKHNQDKISFAIEQLEKVKDFFIEEHRDEEMDTDYIITKDAGEIADYLLDQIEQLKEGK